MSSKLHRFALFLYNFFGITHLFYDGETYRVCRTVTALSTSIYIGSVVFSILISISTTFSVGFVNALFNSEVIELQKFSDFSKTSAQIASISFRVASSLMFIIQILLRNRVQMFMNKAQKCELGEYRKQFQSICMKHSAVLGITYSFILVYQFIATMKVSVISFILMLFMFYPKVVVLGFVSIVKNSENFLVLLLKQYRKDLVELSNESHLNDEMKIINYIKLSRTYREIYNIAGEWNGTFGVPLTLITCVSTLLMGLQVDI